MDKGGKEKNKKQMQERRLLREGDSSVCGSFSEACSPGTPGPTLPTPLALG